MSESAYARFRNALADVGHFYDDVAYMIDCSRQRDLHLIIDVSVLLKLAYPRTLLSRDFDHLLAENSLFGMQDELGAKRIQWTVYSGAISRIISSVVILPNQLVELQQHKDWVASRVFDSESSVLTGEVDEYDGELESLRSDPETVELLGSAGELEEEEESRLTEFLSTVEKEWPQLWFSVTLDEFDIAIRRLDHFLRSDIVADAAQLVDDFQELNQQARFLAPTFRGRFAEWRPERVLSNENDAYGASYIVSLARVLEQRGESILLITDSEATRAIVNEYCESDSALQFDRYALPSTVLQGLSLFGGVALDGTEQELLRFDKFRAWLDVQRSEMLGAVGNTIVDADEFEEKWHEAELVLKSEINATAMVNTAFTDSIWLGDDTEAEGPSDPLNVLRLVRRLLSAVKADTPIQDLVDERLLSLQASIDSIVQSATERILGLPDRDIQPALTAYAVSVRRQSRDPRRQTVDLIGRHVDRYRALVLDLEQDTGTVQFFVDHRSTIEEIRTRAYSETPVSDALCALYCIVAASGNWELARLVLDRILDSISDESSPELVAFAHISRARLNRWNVRSPSGLSVLDEARKEQLLQLGREGFPGAYHEAAIVEIVHAFDLSSIPPPEGTNVPLEPPLREAIALLRAELLNVRQYETRFEELDSEVQLDLAYALNLMHSQTRERALLDEAQSILSGLDKTLLGSPQGIHTRALFEIQRASMMPANDEQFRAYYNGVGLYIAALDFAAERPPWYRKVLRRERRNAARSMAASTLND